MMNSFAATIAFGVLLIGTSPGLAVQRQDTPESAYSGARGFAVLSANVVIGAGTAGIRAWLGDRDVGQAVVRGALGGAVGYAGKRIAVTDWAAAPLSGRVIASFGNAMVASTTDGLRPDSLTIPIGPIRLRFPLSGGRPAVAVSVYDVAVLGQAAVHRDLELDWGRSLSVGAPVFLAPRPMLLDDGHTSGIANGRSVILVATEERIERVFRHEIVHVLQYDFTEQVWDRPIEFWVRERTPARVLPGWLEIGVILPALIGADGLLRGGDRHGTLRGIMQAEAEWFEHR